MEAGANKQILPRCAQRPTIRLLADSRTSPAPTRPLMVFDGDCSFCRRWISRWRSLTCGAIDYEPYQSAAQRLPQVPEENFHRAVHLIEPDGTITTGAHAALR